MKSSDHARDDKDNDIDNDAKWLSEGQVFCRLQHCLHYCYFTGVMKSSDHARDDKDNDIDNDAKWLSEGPRE